MTSLRQLDWPALLQGILIAAVIVGPAAALSIAIVDTDGSASGGDRSGGGLGLVFVALILIGFGIGGARVARLGVDLPLTHGAFVGLLTFAALQVFILLLSAIAGREGGISIAAVAFSALLASSAGMIGASLGRRRTSWHS